jgi:hypothetical protein
VSSTGFARPSRRQAVCPACATLMTFTSGCIPGEVTACTKCAAILAWHGEPGRAQVRLAKKSEVRAFAKLFEAEQRERGRGRA